MKKKIKELRIKIDGLSQLVKDLRGEDIRGTLVGDGLGRPYINNEECLKAYDSLILAKAWLGKILQELGSDSPYKNDGKRKTVEDIEDSSDKASVIVGIMKPFTNQLDSYINIAQAFDGWELNGNNMIEYSDKSHIEKVDWLREEVKKIITQYRNLEIIEDLDIARKISLISRYIYQHLSEARFWLGFELARIKKDIK